MLSLRPFSLARIAVLLFLFVASAAHAADLDMILLTNGNEYFGKLNSISDREVRFILKNGEFLSIPESPASGAIPVNHVYMIKTAKRGTTFIVDGKRVIRESPKIEKGADIIYLTEGREVPAFNISLSDDILSYTRGKEPRKAMSDICQFYIGKVFMVKYSDGSRDIFNLLDEKKNQPADNYYSSMTSGTQSQSGSGSSSIGNSSATQLKVVFHAVKEKETLGDIARMYDVTVPGIIEWNDLDPKANANYHPKTGTQLMLQVVLH